MEELTRVEDLIPHRGRMKLLDRFTLIERHRACGATAAADQWPLHRDGLVSSLIAVELVAQTAAAVSAWREHDQGEDHTGYIAGIKEARFHIDHFRVGDALTTEAMCPHLMNNNNTLYGVFHGRVFHGDRTAAEVSVQIVRPPKSGGRKKG